jgi:hypothetical protein
MHTNKKLTEFFDLLITIDSLEYHTCEISIYLLETHFLIVISLDLRRVQH